MGNWHCVPNSCATVVYREYKPPVVRWRYEGENWQEIIGANDYELVEIPALFTGGQCCDQWYTVHVHTEEARYTNPSAIFRVYPDVQIRLKGKIRGLVFIPPSQTFLNGVTLWHSWGIEYEFCDGTIQTWINTLVSSRYGYREDLCYITYVEPDPGSYDNCGDPPSECEFIVYKNGAIVHQETREDCPEVEVLPCHLSEEYKQIKIDKLPYLERVEVVDYAYDVRWGIFTDSDQYGFLLFKGQIPNNCLNIYKNNITSIIPNDFISITNTPENGFNLISQICSHPDCPPPEYEVICGGDCTCESCPEGTCAINCGDHICCYDSDGIAVKSIPKENYCNE